MKIKIFLSLCILFINFIISAQTSYKSTIGGITSTYTYYAQQPVATQQQIIVNNSTPAITTQYVNSASTPFMRETYFKQKVSIYLGFDKLKTAVIDPLTDEIIDSYQTNNYGLYFTNPNRTEFTFEEYDPTGKKIKNYTHHIINISEDATVISLTCKNGAQVYKVHIWKDGTMIVLDDNPDIYLVTGISEIMQY